MEKSCEEGERQNLGCIWSSWFQSHKAATFLLCNSIVKQLQMTSIDLACRAQHRPLLSWAVLLGSFPRIPGATLYQKTHLLVKKNSNSLPLVWLQEAQSPLYWGVSVTARPALPPVPYLLLPSHSLRSFRWRGQDRQKLLCYLVAYGSAELEPSASQGETVSHVPTYSQGPGEHEELEVFSKCT